MSLWAKIQTLNMDCQKQILSLYGEEHPKYKFPIELRNLFAEVIESAVCGGDISSVDGGLDPYNQHHRDQIGTFFSTLICQIEERLGNAGAGDQFFTRHKLSEALANLKEKQQTDLLGMYEHVRNRIKTEVSLVVAQEAAKSSNMVNERDVILENIQGLKAQISGVANILKEIRTNEETFALHVNKQQELEAILTNPEQVRLFTQQVPDYESRVRSTLATLTELIQQSIRNFQNRIQQFENEIINNLNHVSILQGQLIQEKLAQWKHEQQQMANGIHKVHFVSLDRLQLWCEELADLIWKNYGQLKEAENILQKGLIQGNNANLTFVQSRTEEVLRLLQELLNHSLIVEEQPPQIIKMKTKFPKAVVVSMLVGKRLNIHMNSPELTVRLISEDQARTLPVTDILETMGEITNGKVLMENKEDCRRITFPFRNLQLKSIKRTDRRGSTSTERVMEEKSCLYFECTVPVGPQQFKVSTISLPVVVISHGSQEALAVASISWDNAFGEIGRIPFRVPSSAPWEDVAQILNAKFLEVTGRGLTPDNLYCLAKKAFRKSQPQAEISWVELCKDNLPNKNFTFWAWFHAALKLIEKKETNLKELWKEGLIMGFVERETAESLISNCKTGTFLLRFSDSILGAITIALLARPGTVLSLNPFQMLDLQTKKISLSIKEVEKLKFLYQPNRSNPIPKDEAFGKFYETDKEQQAGLVSGYVPLMAVIPDDSESGSATPVPNYDGSGNGRFSHGSLPGLSPLNIEQTHSPFFPTPPSPPTSMQEAHSPATTISAMEYYDGSDATSSQNGLIFINHNGMPLSPASNQGELETPLPVVASNGSMFFPNAFEDLIHVMHTEHMESEHL